MLTGAAGLQLDRVTVLHSGVDAVSAGTVR